MLKNLKGITDVELLISMLILSIVIAPMGSMFFSGAKRTISREEKVVGRYIAQMVMEDFRNKPYDKIASLPLTPVTEYYDNLGLPINYSKYAFSVDVQWLTEDKPGYGLKILDSPIINVKNTPADCPDQKIARLAWIRINVKWGQSLIEGGNTITTETFVCNQDVFGNIDNYNENYSQKIIDCD